MNSMGRKFSRKDIEKMIADVDVDNNGSIEFDEFLLMMCKDEDSEFELHEAFKKFDKDGDGEVTAEEVRAVLKKLGQNLSDAELEAMITEVDLNGDGVISFQEFKQLMVSERNMCKFLLCLIYCHYLYTYTIFRGIKFFQESQQFLLLLCVDFLFVQLNFI